MRGIGSRSFVYNPVFQLTSEEIGGIYTKTINRTYSDSGFKGRYTGMNIGGEYGVNYGYDNYGRVNGIVSGENSFAYDYLANSDAAASMSAAVNGTPVLSRVFTFEPHRNLISRVENKHGANIISGFTYANDAIGRRQHVLRERVTDIEQKNALLRKFWNIPVRQVETSVVLADAQARIKSTNT